jgi:hypothetical protein
VGTYTERIARGAAFLDEKQPGWRERIDLGELDLNSSECCILGQLFPGSYFSTLSVLFGDDKQSTAMAYGFESRLSAEGSQLTAEWREYIESTRAVA